MNVEAIPGLLWGYHFDAAGYVTAFEPAALERVLHSGSGWTWLHLNLANARAREWLVRAPLPEPVRHVLLDDEELPMLCGIDGVGVGVLADLKREVGHSTEETARVRFAVSERLLVTCRRHPLSSVEAAHAAVRPLDHHRAVPAGNPRDRHFRHEYRRAALGGGCAERLRLRAGAMRDGQRRGVLTAAPHGRDAVARRPRLA